ncbi:peptidylprolyl isomerase [Nitrospina watsonii]|uniref:peptidylprolyl isomerase n=1 Tax=Nitrospina watsonii TaxID=1323948 RepID=A0ABM9HAS3_9BACT|nr:peptidylprolyl isomerase [Nitrospina watsonii]CAI2717263.1 Putative PpiC-type peptidyl-prolyl cis-trans isomerase [Nitrospina watsonii]
MFTKSALHLSGLLLLAALTLWPASASAQVADTHAPDSARMEINGRLVPPIVATVNGRTIPGTMLVNQVQMYKMFHQQQGHSVSPEQEAEYARQALDNLIGQELLFQKSKEWGIAVDDKTVRAEAKKIRDQFPSEEMFQHTLRLQGLNAELLHASIEKQLVEESVVRAKIAPKVDVPEDTVKTFYEQNLEQFMQPPRWEFSHIFAAAVKQDAPEDPAMQERFHKLQNMVETDARAKINKALAALKTGKAFEDVAGEYSEHEETAKNGGKWGTMARHEMPDEIYQAVSKLKPGETSGIVRSEYGFHILRLDNALPEEAMPLDQVKSDLLNHLLKEEVEKEKDKLVAGLRDDADIEVFF